jgi:hypothetical protein
VDSSARLVDQWWQYVWQVVGSLGIQLTAPASLLPGYSGGYILKAETFDAPFISSVERLIWIGTPVISGSVTISGNENVGINSSQTVIASSASGVGKYHWTIVPDNLSCSSGGTMPNFSITGNMSAITSSPQVSVNHGSCTGTFRVRLNAVNNCGIDDYNDKVITVTDGSGPCSGALRISPNPTAQGDITNIRIAPCDLRFASGEDDKKFKDKDISKIIVVDEDGTVVFEKNKVGKKAELNQFSNKKGTCFIYVFDDEGRVYVERVVIN